jgi:hypothetical protein
MLFIAGMLAFGSLLVVEESVFQKTIWVGTSACGVGFILMTISSRIALDPTKNRFSHYESTLGFTSGHWGKLPLTEKMEMVQHFYTCQNTPNGISLTFSSKLLIHKVVLISSEKIELSLDFSSEKAAVKAMKRM